MTRGWPGLRFGSIALLALSAACGHGDSPKAVSVGDDGGDEVVEKIVRIPMTDAQGGQHQLYTRLCFPASGTPFRVAVINHGSPDTAAERASMQPWQCDSPVATWFLARDYAVVFALRRGYGETGGTWAEAFGSCDAPDYHGAGLETARDIAAIVDYATALPQVLHDSAVVVGVSAGGWGTIAYDSVPHAKTAALINMSGGRGGHQNGMSGANCRPEALAEGASSYGQTASTAMLWVYAANDSYFAPEIATAMHTAFVDAGGTAKLQQVAAFGTDGHALFGAVGGDSVWGPLFESYLAEQLPSTR